MVAIQYDEALKRILTTTPSGARRLNIVRYGDEHKFTCYGASEKEEAGTTVHINHLKYFDLYEKNEGKDDDLD